MSEETSIREKILKAAEKDESGKVACAFLLDLAGRSGTSPKEIGELCEQLNIRIRTCQLGCFP